MVDAIVATSPGHDLLDVGIGTAVSARPFREAGCRVTGIDVDERMAHFARRSGFDVEIGKFEDWDPLGRTFDAVISGQTWHWIDPVAGAAKAAGVLRPHGRLAAFWNVFQPPPDLAAAIAGVYQRLLPDTPFSGGISGGMNAYAPQFARAADGIGSADGLAEPDQWEFPWERAYSRDEWLDVVPTFGGHNQFPPGVLDEVLAGIGAAIDAVGGSFTMQYTAVVVTALRNRNP